MRKKIGFILINVVPIILAFAIGFGFVQVNTDKNAARRNFSDYIAHLRLYTMMRNDPVMKPVFVALRNNFPQEMHPLLKQFIENAMHRRETSNGIVEYRSGEALGVVTEFLDAQSANISRSSDDHLVKVFFASKAVIENARGIPAVCAGLVTGDRIF